MKHLAIFRGFLAEDILAGKKTIESRFSKRHDPPFGVISAGDLVYVKPAGKDIIGQFRVKKVIFFDGLDSADLNQIKERYNDQICADTDYWQSHKEAKYGTLIFIDEYQSFITSPVRISKKDLRGWVVLG